MFMQRANSLKNEVFFCIFSNAILKSTPTEMLKLLFLFTYSIAVFPVFSRTESLRRPHNKAQEWEIEVALITKVSSLSENADFKR